MLEAQRQLDLLDAARREADALPRSLVAQLTNFRDAPPPSGCLLVRGLPVGDLPPTPGDPLIVGDKSDFTEVLLLAVASVLGEPVGYLPESRGALVQNLVPVRAMHDHQTSTSSSVDLMFHTEAAFHPHRPKYLLLFCLRGDPEAVTTSAAVQPALAQLDPATIDVLFEPRFRCAVDESYLNGRINVLGPPTAVLSGDRLDPRMVFDEDLMVGTDEEAHDALAALGCALVAVRQSIVLEAGDLLVIDNDLVVHGRSPFRPRFDGTDRWVQRAMVVPHLDASADDRAGRIINTTFGLEP
jgi:L-asparagine oxygenase